ncbi:MAG: polysaccharide deacetylase family protein [Candidatus Woesearchaeota archaeon]|nr:polysaccharide deacetylase family protein [Candidatus Woesearchaeota archaeon]
MVEMREKKVTVFFDFEAWWEAPYRGRFDIERITRQILEVLDKNRISATFNTCGVVAKFFPELVGEVHSRGHEISCHGNRHENFAQLSRAKANSALDSAENEIRKATGHKPEGIRFPWMFSTELSYIVAKERGYKWASNYHVPLPEAFGRPDYHSSSYSLARMLFYVKEKFSEKKPFLKNGLVEIPVLSSSDGELLSLVSPEQDSGRDFLNYSLRTWKRQFLHSGEYFNLNFHPWLIGSGNRIKLLSDILAFINEKKRDKNVVFVKGIEIAEKSLRQVKA